MAPHCSDQSIGRSVRRLMQNPRGSSWGDVSFSVGGAGRDRLQREEAVSVPIRAGDRLGDLRKAAVNAAVPGAPVVEDHDPLETAVPFADQQSSGFEPDTLACRRSAGCKGTSVPRLEGFVPVLVQTSQNRPVEIPECRGLDPIGEHAQEQPSRKMGGSNPDQVVSPLEAKLKDIESGRRGDAAVMKDLSRLIQNGDLEPGVVPPITGRPYYSPDTLGPEVECGRRRTEIQNAGGIRCWRGAGTVSDDVDAPEQTFQRRLCRAGGLGQVIAETERGPHHADGASDDAHAHISQCAKVERVPVRPSYELKGRLGAGALQVRNLGRCLVEQADLFEPPPSVAPTVAPR